MYLAIVTTEKNLDAGDLAYEEVCGAYDTLVGADRAAADGDFYVDEGCVLVIAKVVKVGRPPKPAGLTFEEWK